jgi:multidrug efflux pump subunit AcrB
MRSLVVLLLCSTAAAAPVRYTVRSDQRTKAELQRWLDEQVMPALAGADVSVCGGERWRYTVDVSADKLRQYRLVAEDVLQAIRKPRTLEVGQLAELPIGGRRMLRDVAVLAHNSEPQPCQARMLVITVDGADVASVRAKLAAVVRPVGVLLTPLPEVTTIDVPSKDALAFDLTQLERALAGIDTVIEGDVALRVRVLDRKDVVRALVAIRRAGYEAAGPDDRLVQVLAPDHDRAAACARALEQQLGSGVVAHFGTREVNRIDIAIDHDRARNYGVNEAEIRDTLDVDGAPIVRTLDGGPIEVHVVTTDGAPSKEVEVRGRAGLVPLREVVTYASRQAPVVDLRDGTDAWVGLRVHGALPKLEAPAGCRVRTP